MSGTTAPTTVESFTINPCAGDINPSTESGSKLYLKATEEVPQRDKSHISISNGTKISDMLEKYRSKYAWGILLSKVLDNNGDN